MNLNEEIVATGQKYALAVTGAGMIGATEFFKDSGASAFIEDIEIPYAQAAFDRVLRARGDMFLWNWKKTESGYCSMEGTIALAKAIWFKNFGMPNGPQGIGIGVSGKLTVPNEREGRSNSVYFAVIKGDVLVATTTMVLIKESREEQEKKVSAELHRLMKMTWR